MTSRSVAQIATASIRTSTSARFGTGTVFSTKFSSPGLPSTQARIRSGIGNSLWLVLTPAGAYIVVSGESERAANGPLVSVDRGEAIGLRRRRAELGRQCARRRGDLLTHQREVLVGRPHQRRRGADRPDHRAGQVADRRADADHARQVLLAVECVALAPDRAHGVM